MSDPTSPTPPPDEAMPDQARARIRAELLEAAQRPRTVRRWIVPGAVAASVVLVIGLAAWVVQAGTGTGHDDGAPPAAATSSSALPTGPPSTVSSTVPSTVPSTLPSTLPSRSPGGAGARTARASCNGEVAGVLPGAREVAAFGRGRSSWFTGFWATEDRFVLCDVRAGITTVHHPRPLDPIAGVSTYAVSSVDPGWPHSSAVIRVAGGIVPAGATAFDVTYTFPNGGTQHARTTTDDRGRTWWRMLYVYEDGGGNETTLPPIRVHVSYSGLQRTYELRWGLDTCAQANHGC